jgi:hypothetical protein
MGEDGMDDRREKGGDRGCFPSGEKGKGDFRKNITLTSFSERRGYK